MDRGWGGNGVALRDEDASEGDAASGIRVASGSTRIAWHPAARVATIRYARDTNLTGKDAVFLVDSLMGWIANGEPFAVLCDADGIGGTDAEYRRVTGSFFRQYRDASCIALFNLGPALRLVAETFRIGTGIQVKAFADETAARAWLRTKGFAA
jgi:hypothetical protein